MPGIPFFSFFFVVVFVECFGWEFSFRVFNLILIFEFWEGKVLRLRGYVFKT